MHSNTVIARAMESTLKQSTYIIDYNSNSDFDFKNNVEYFNIDLLCNKLYVRLLANNSATHTKKKRVLKLENKVNKQPKAKTT